MIGPLSGNGPLYRQVYDAIREAIVSGQMPSGSRLPATRALELEIGISRTTIRLAYDELIAEGYATGLTGSGTFVSEPLPDPSVEEYAANAREIGLSGRPSKHLSRFARAVSLLMPKLNLETISRHAPLRYDFQYERVSHEDFPFRLWFQLIAKYDRMNFTSSSMIEANLRLREAIRKHVIASRGVVCDSDQIIVVNGTQQAIDLAARLLLSPGDTVAIEEAHYPEARNVFRVVPARLLPLPLDEDGVQVEVLSRRRRKTRIAAVYVTPSHQMPTGAVLSLERRVLLVRWAEQNDAYIFEDDFDSEHSYSSRPLQSVQGISRSERVIYVGSFSRVISPNLRIGYVIVPRHLTRLFRDAKWLADRNSPGALQFVMAEFLEQGHYDRYLRRLRARNSRRRTALLEAFAEQFGSSVSVFGSDAGIHVMVRFRELAPSSISTLITRAAKAGVGIYNLSPHYLKPVARNEVLMGFGALSEGSLREGIRLLSKTLAEVTDPEGTGVRPKDPRDISNTVAHYSSMTVASSPISR